MLVRSPLSLETIPKYVHDREWVTEGACTHVREPDQYFYGESARGPARLARERIAKAICKSCPVLAECRRYALEMAEPFGVWGGMSEDDRARILQHRAS